MNRITQRTNIISGGLECLSKIINKYAIDHKIFFQVTIGSDGGMAPEITIAFFGSQYDKSAPMGEIEMWTHEDVTKCALIYSLYDPKSDDNDHLNQDLDHPNDAFPYFERAVQQFGIQPYEVNP